MITTQAHKTSSNLSIDRETSASPTSNKLEIEKTSTACSRANQGTKNDLISVESTTNTIRILTSEEDNTGLRIEDRDYTIVVPKNIHVKGVNVQLGLKTGEEMLATVSEKHNHKYAPANRIPSRSSNFNGSNCEHSPNVSRPRFYQSENSLLNGIDGKSQDVSSTTGDKSVVAVGSSCMKLHECNGASAESVPVSSSIEDYHQSVTNEKKIAYEDNDHEVSSSAIDHFEIPTGEQSDVSDIYREDFSRNNVASCSSSNISHQQNSNSSSVKSVVKKSKGTITYCIFDKDGKQCRQRAITDYAYCIRHILCDPVAPYKKCMHRIKPKNRNMEFHECTNAIRSDKTENYCSTHMIMNGLKDPKIKVRKGADLKISNSSSSKIVLNNEYLEDVDDFIANEFGEGFETSSSDKITLSSPSNSKSSSILTPHKYQQNPAQNLQVFSEDIRKDSIDNLSSRNNSLAGFSKFHEKNSAGENPRIVDFISASKKHKALNTSELHQAHETGTSFNILEREYFSSEPSTSQQPAPPMPLVAYQVHPLSQQSPHLSSESQNCHKKSSAENPGTSLGMIRRTADGNTSVLLSPQHSGRFSKSFQNQGFGNNSEPNSFASQTNAVNFIPPSHLYQNHHQFFPQRFAAPHSPVSLPAHFISRASTPGSLSSGGPASLPPRPPSVHQHLSRESPIRRPSSSTFLIHPQISLSQETSLDHSSPLPSAPYAFQTMNPTTNIQSNDLRSLSLLSKQHPQLAAKLLQPSQVLSSQVQNQRHSREDNFSPTHSSGYMKGSDQTNNYANDSKVYTMLKIPAEPVSGPPEVVDQYQYAPQFSLKPQISGGDNHPNSSMVTNPSQGINSQLYNGKQLDRGMTLLQRSRIDLQEYIGSRNYASAIPDRTINFIKSILPISGVTNSTAVSPMASLNVEPPPVRYNVDTLLLTHDNSLDGDVREELKIRHDYTTGEIDANDVIHKPPQPRVIKLRQKRKKVRVTGRFRTSNPSVNTVCRVIEGHDFDQTDLFPLGLEPSDDESSSDDIFPLSIGEDRSSLHSDFCGSFSENWPTIKNGHAQRLELYLLKKQLRLESSRLVHHAKIAIPMNAAVETFPNSVGSALRIREMNSRREHIRGVQPPRLRRCAYVIQKSLMSIDVNNRSGRDICSNFALPMAHLCSHHISYNVPLPPLFQYCNYHCCREVVIFSDSLLFDGYCRRHFNEMHPGRKTTRSFTAAKRHSASSTEADSSHPCQKMARPDTLVSIPKGNASNGIHCFPTQMVYNCDPLRTNHHIFPSHPLVHPHSIASQSNINSRALHPNHGSNDQCDTEGDVSLESVAKDLGFDSRELTDILDQFPVEDSLVAGGEIEDDNGLSHDLNKVDAGDDALMDVMRNVKNSHSWADVEQFLLEQDGIGQGIHQGQHCISGQIVGLNQHIPTRHDRLFHDSASLIQQIHHPPLENIYRNRQN